MKKFLKSCLLVFVLTIFLINFSTGESYGASYNRRNPAPIGIKQTVTVDNYFENYRMEITVTESIRGHQAWNLISEANMFNSSPEADEEYILAKIKVKLLYSEGDKRIDLSTWDFKMYSSNNVEYDLNFVVEPSPQLDTSLYQGSEHEGYAAFLVKKSDSNPKIVFGERYDGTGGVWFKFTKDGSINRGWVSRGGSWYYYDSSGQMQTGWLSDGGKWYYLANNGQMQTGWLLNGGKWYYLNSNGAMRTGWLFNGGQWFYLSSSGVMRTGWLLDKGNWYYFSTNGAMRTGWMQSGSDWYYLSGSGAMRTGWLWDGGSWWYLYSGGSMARNVTIDGYKIGNNGAMIR